MERVSCTFAFRHSYRTMIPARSALFDDSCLYLVPGSHALPRTSEQRSQSSTMDPPKYLDAGHSDPPSESSTASIEMNNLEDMPVAPIPINAKDVYDVEENGAEFEDDSVDEDDGQRALLQNHDRPRGRERSLSASRATSIWAQVKGIVIEVSILTQ